MGFLNDVKDAVDKAVDKAEDTAQGATGVDFGGSGGGKNANDVTDTNEDTSKGVTDNPGQAASEAAEGAGQAVDKAEDTVQETTGVDVGGSGGGSSDTDTETTESAVDVDVGGSSSGGDSESDVAGGDDSDTNGSEGTPTRDQDNKPVNRINDKIGKDPGKPGKKPGEPVDFRNASRVGDKIGKDPGIVGEIPGFSGTFRNPDRRTMQQFRNTDIAKAKNQTRQSILQPNQGAEQKIRNMIKKNPEIVRIYNNLQNEKRDRDSSVGLPDVTNPMKSLEANQELNKSDISKFQRLVQKGNITEGELNTIAGEERAEKIINSVSEFFEQGLDFLANPPTNKNKGLTSISNNAGKSVGFQPPTDENSGLTSIYEDTSNDNLTGQQQRELISQGAAQTAELPFQVQRRGGQAQQLASGELTVEEAVNATKKEFRKTIKSIQKNPKKAGLTLTGSSLTGALTGSALARTTGIDLDPLGRTVKGIGKAVNKISKGSSKELNIEVKQGEDLGRLDSRQAEVDEQGNIRNPEQIDRVGEVKGVSQKDGETVFQSEQPFITALVKDQEGNIQDVFVGRSTATGVSDETGARGLIDLQALKLEQAGQKGNVEDTFQTVRDFEIEGERTGQKGGKVTIDKKEGGKKTYEERVQEQFEGRVGDTEFQGRGEKDQVVDTDIGRKFKQETVSADENQNAVITEDLESSGSTDRLKSKGLILNKNILEGTGIKKKLDFTGDGKQDLSDLSETELRQLRKNARDLFGTKAEAFFKDLDQKADASGTDTPDTGSRDVDTGGDQALKQDTSKSDVTDDFTGTGTDEVSRKAFEDLVRSNTGSTSIDDVSGVGDLVRSGAAGAAASVTPNTGLGTGQGLGEDLGLGQDQGQNQGQGQDQGQKQEQGQEQKQIQKLDKILETELDQETELGQETKQQEISVLERFGFERTESGTNTRKELKAPEQQDEDNRRGRAGLLAPNKDLDLDRSLAADILGVEGELTEEKAEKLARKQGFSEFQSPLSLRAFKKTKS